MRWLSQARLPARRVCLQAGLQVEAGSQGADFHAADFQAADFQAADFQAAGLRAPADSTARRCPGVGSAVEAVVPGR
jgi:uncharacterized protein YjbI with pentapeptide repeats